MVRCFLGVCVPRDIKTKLISIQKRLTETGAKLRLVAPENLHWTLKFLGELSDHQIRLVKGVVSEVVVGINPFGVSLAGVGVFPDPTRPRVCWVGVIGGAGFQNTINKTVNPVCGFRPEHKETTPHITIARIKHETDNKRLMRVLSELKDSQVGEFRVNRVFLYQSALTQHGPIYSELGAFDLGGGV